MKRSSHDKTSSRMLRDAPWQGLRPMVRESNLFARTGSSCMSVRLCSEECLFRQLVQKYSTNKRSTFFSVHRENILKSPAFWLRIGPSTLMRSKLKLSPPNQPHPLGSKLWEKCGKKLEGRRGMEMVPFALSRSHIMCPQTYMETYSNVQ